MRIFDLLQLGKSSGLTCQQCAHFQNDPAFIEEAFPGLTIVSSGYASVRDKDGLCNYHQLYLSARDGCPDFARQVSGPHQAEVENALLIRS